MTVIVPRQPQTQPPGVPTTDRSTTDPLSTPRAVLPRAVVAAAVASIPTLSPVLLPHEPEYCLAPKRKAADLDADDDENEAIRAIKKPKNDPQEALFGPLNTPPQADAPQQAQFDITIQEAIAAALYVFPHDAQPEPAPIAVDAPSLVDQLAIEYPSHPPLALSAFGDVLPTEDPAAQTWQDPPVPGFFPGDVSPQPVAGSSSSVIPPPVVAVEGIDIIPEQPQPVPAATTEQDQAAQCGKPKRNEPLWETACRDRMRIVIGLCGSWKALRTVLGQPSPEPKKAEQQPEAKPQDDSAKSVVNDSRSVTSDAAEDLPMEIYTPDNFEEEEMDDDSDETEREPTESEIEDAADASFDLDDPETDPEDYEDYEDSDDCDPSSIEPDEHESIMEVTVEQPSTSAVPLSSPPPELPPTPAPVATIEISSTPELPRLATFRAQVLREWIMPDLRRGTPRRVHPSHCGVLTRDHLRAAAQRDRDAWRAMWQ